MKGYPVVRTDKMYGTDVRSGMVSLRVASAPMYNGMIVDIAAGLEANGDVTEREIYAAVGAAKEAKFENVVLVASPEVMYDERMKALDDFMVEVGGIARGYRLHHGDIFSVTAAALEGNPDTNKVVELGGKMAAGMNQSACLKVVASATSGSTQIGKIIATEQVGPYKYYVIEVA